MDVAAGIQETLDLIPIRVQAPGDGQGQRHETEALVGAAQLQIRRVDAPVHRQVPGAGGLVVAEDAAGVAMGIDVHQLIGDAGGVDAEPLEFELPQPGREDHDHAHHGEGHDEQRDGHLEQGETPTDGWMVGRHGLLIIILYGLSII